jgi:hypothetical protein
MVERRGHHAAQPVGQLERLGVAHLEGRRIVELGGLLLDRLDDLRAALWPALQHHSPAVPSSTWRPSAVL